jgi:hypothetical protein
MISYNMRISNKAYKRQLTLAIKNDQNVALARKGIQTIPVQRQIDMPLDSLANKAQAYNNLITVLGPEQANAFLVGQSDEDISKINIFWNDLKPKLSTKIGLPKNIFDEIVESRLIGKGRTRFGSEDPNDEPESEQYESESEDEEVLTPEEAEIIRVHRLMTGDTRQDRPLMRPLIREHIRQPIVYQLSPEQLAELIAARIENDKRYRKALNPRTGGSVLKRLIRT